LIQLSHKKLEVWKKSLELILEVYSITNKFPKEELFSLTNQIRRASISIISNLSEGASRKSSLEKKRFFEISRSSLVEIDTQIEVALKLDYLNDNDIKKLAKLSNEIFAMLTSLIKKYSK